MTNVLIDVEVMKAIGLNFAFMGVMISIVAIGISYLLYKISKRTGREYFKMAGLILGWAVFIALSLQLSAEASYVSKFFIYSTAHLFSIFVGIIIISLFFCMFSDFWKKNIFDKRLLIWAGVFAVLAVLLRLIFPFFRDPYLGLLARVIMIVPALLGFFMIIKSYIGEEND